jgi:hypothetical protein
MAALQMGHIIIGSAVAQSASSPTVLPGHQIEIVSVNVVWRPAWLV